MVKIRKFLLFAFLFNASSAFAANDSACPVSGNLFLVSGIYYWTSSTTFLPTGATSACASNSTAIQNVDDASACPAGFAEVTSSSVRPGDGGTLTNDFGTYSYSNCSI